MGRLHGRKDVGIINTTNMHIERKWGGLKDNVTYHTTTMAVVSYIE